jgi:hypothetical protein
MEKVHVICGSLILAGGFAPAVRALDLAFKREFVDD